MLHEAFFPLRFSENSFKQNLTIELTGQFFKFVFPLYSLIIP